jgi:hypothetical protein
MSVQIDWDFAGDNDAKQEIGAAVRYLLRDATGNARGDIVQEINGIVRDVANSLLSSRSENSPDAGAVKQPAMSGIAYKAYVIDAFQRDTDRWRATVRRLNGKKIRVIFPPSVLDEVTTSADALTAEKAVELARTMIDGGGLI